MVESSSDFRLDRERLTRILRRWAAVIVTSAAVAAIASFGASKVLASEYEATAQLYLAPASNPTVAFQDVVLGQTLAKSYVQLATAEVVLRRAMDQVGYRGDLKSFTSHVRVVQVRDTSVIAMTFRSQDAASAADTANAVANSFIDQSRALQASLQGTTAIELEQQIAAVQSDIRSLDDQILGLRVQIAATPRPGESPAAKSDLQTQVLQLDASRQAKQQTLAQLLKTRDDMRLAQARAETTVSLWQPATPPEDPVSPRPLLNTAVGGVLGGLVALVIVGIVAYFDDRLTDPDDTRRRLDIAALGQVRLRAHPESMSGKLFIRDEPTAAEAEAIRSVRTNVLFASVDRRPRSILVTSAVSGEGKSVLSANLALAFAEAGTPTVLIDADLRRPTQHRMFRASPAQGLTTLLTQNSSFLQVQLEQFRVAPQLLVIPSGPLPPNPAELLASEKMASLIRYLAGLTENALVIVDSSPILAVADAIALSARVDGCLLVIDSSGTRVSLTRRAITALRQVNATVLGAVLNKMSESHAKYYGYQSYHQARPGQVGTAQPRRN